MVDVFFGKWLILKLFDFPNFWFFQKLYLEFSVLVKLLSSFFDLRFSSDEDLGNRLFDARIEPELSQDSQEQSENQEKPAPPAESDNLMTGDKNV